MCVYGYGFIKGADKAKRRVIISASYHLTSPITSLSALFSLWHPTRGALNIHERLLFFYALIKPMLTHGGQSGAVGS